MGESRKNHGRSKQGMGEDIHTETYTDMNATGTQVRKRAMGELVESE